MEEKVTHWNYGYPWNSMEEKVMPPLLILLWKRQHIWQSKLKLNPTHSKWWMILWELMFASYIHPQLLETVLNTLISKKLTFIKLFSTECKIKELCSSNNNHWQIDTTFLTSGELLLKVKKLLLPTWTTS